MEVQATTVKSDHTKYNNITNHIGDTYGVKYFVTQILECL